MEKEIDDLISASRDNYVAAIRIADAYDRIYFNEKAKKIFMEGGEIYKQVKDKLKEKKLPDLNYYDDRGDGWDCFAVTFGNGCILDINYDMKAFRIKADKKNPISAETAETIKGIMVQKIKDRGENEKGYIWHSSKNAKYPDINDVDCDDVYFYDLYKIYSEEPQSVANWIVSLVEELKNI